MSDDNKYLLKAIKYLEILSIEIDDVNTGDHDFSEIYNWLMKTKDLIKSLARVEDDS